MAKFTNVSGVLRFVNYGLRSTTAVKAGDPLEVPDDVAGAYACQPSMWRPADAAAVAAVKALTPAPAKATPAKKTTAKKTAPPAVPPPAAAPKPAAPSAAEPVSTPEEG